MTITPKVETQIRPTCSARLVPHTVLCSKRIDPVGDEGIRWFYRNLPETDREDAVTDGNVA